MQASHAVQSEQRIAGTQSQDAEGMAQLLGKELRSIRLRIGKEETARAGGGLHPAESAGANPAGEAPGETSLRRSCGGAARGYPLRSQGPVGPPDGNLDGSFG